MSASEPVVPGPAPVAPVTAPGLGEPPPATPGFGGPPLTASGLPNPHGLPEIAVDRPEVAVGAAFGGGLLLALVLKRLAG